MNKQQEPTDKFSLSHLTGAERAEMSITPNSPVIMPEICQARLEAYKKAIEGENLRGHGKKKAIPRNAKTETPISNVYPVVDNDLARDNLENDIPAVDLQDL